MTGWKAILREVLCGACKYSGALALGEALLRVMGRHFMIVLLYHRVTDAIPEDGLTVSTARFRWMCRLLKRRFNVVPLGEVFRILRARETPPRRTVAITFDDSYRDNLFAAQVLAEHGLAATFFIPTGYVGTELTFPWDRDLPRIPNLSWDDIRAMVGLGMEIGSHTVSHANLGATDAQQAWSELHDSRAELQTQLGRPVRWLAYPFGGREDLRPEYVPMIRAAGYEGAVSAFDGFVWPGCDDRILPREAMTGFKSPLYLEAFLSGCLPWLMSLRGRSRWKIPAPWEAAAPADPVVKAAHP
jgi:peptidoglycan/xylan/chitin deacetylase (PgdA/CDA1 family)